MGGWVGRRVLAKDPSDVARCATPLSKVLDERVKASKHSRSLRRRSSSLVRLKDYEENTPRTGDGMPRLVFLGTLPAGLPHLGATSEATGATRETTYLHGRHFLPMLPGPG